MASHDPKSAPRTQILEEPLVPVDSTSLVARSRGVTRLRIGAENTQLAVLVPDLSGSMSVGNKIGELHASLVALVSELANPENRDAFQVCVVPYGERAGVHLPATPATAVRPESLALRCESLGSLTNIAAGLALAHAEVRRSLAEGTAKQLRPVVVLLTDGGHNAGPRPEPVATALKADADAIAVAFGADADLALLQNLATAPALAIRCSNGRDLRQYFAKVARTMSAAAKTGASATALLARGGVVRG